MKSFASRTARNRGELRYLPSISVLSIGWREAVASSQCEAAFSFLRTSAFACYIACMKKFLSSISDNSCSSQVQILAFITAAAVIPLFAGAAIEDLISTCLEYIDVETSSSCKLNNGLAAAAAVLSLIR